MAYAGMALRCDAMALPRTGIPTNHATTYRPTLVVGAAATPAGQLGRAPRHYSPVAPAGAQARQPIHPGVDARSGRAL